MLPTRVRHTGSPYFPVTRVRRGCFRHLRRIVTVFHTCNTGPPPSRPLHRRNSRDSSGHCRPGDTLGEPLSDFLYFLSIAGNPAANLTKKNLKPPPSFGRLKIGFSRSLKAIASPGCLSAISFHFYYIADISPDRMSLFFSLFRLGGYFLAPPFPPRYNKTQEANIAIAAAAVCFRGHRERSNIMNRGLSAPPFAR